jgi:hypothetical protein
MISLWRRNRAAGSMLTAIKTRIIKLAVIDEKAHWWAASNAGLP